MGQMTFIPASTEQAKELRSGADPGLHRGCSVTTALLRALEPQTTTEEAEFAALSNAGVLALLVSSEPTQLVLAAEVEPAQITASGDAAGEITLSSLSWAQVQALFLAEPEAAEAAKKARQAVAECAGEVTLAAALQLPEIVELLEGYDLLWFAPEELDHLVPTGDPTEIAANRAD
jgi:hypothetical protein